MSDHISIDRWGSDHWSTLAYLETRIVDHRGVPHLDHMRVDMDIHPQFDNQGSRFDSKKRCPTRLNDGTTVEKHDDWSCAEDMEREGLLEWNGTGINPVFSLTEKGWQIAMALRRHRASGGQYKDFRASKVRYLMGKQR